MFASSLKVACTAVRIRYARDERLDDQSWYAKRVKDGNRTGSDCSFWQLDVEVQGPMEMTSSSTC